MRIGLREANQRFSRVVRAIRAGREVVLTERGRPVAVIRPVAPAPDIEGVIRELEASGLVRAASRNRPLPPWTPRPIEGQPMAHTIREERDAS